MSRRARALPTQTLEVTRFELSCGATLLVTPRPGAPVFAVDVHLRGGPSLDRPGLEGTSYLVGGLASEGTQRHDEEQLAALLEPAGGELSGDSSGLNGCIEASQWKLLLKVCGEVLTTPTFPTAQVRRQQQRLLQRLQIEAADPRRRGANRFRAMIYGDHWLGRPAYGSRESVAKIEPRHLRAYHARNWVACRGVIAVCGDVAPEAVRDELERCLRRWPLGRPLVKTPAVFPEPRAEVVVVPAERQQAHLYLGHLGIRRADPDYATLVVLDHVLGQGPGFTNRVGRILRDELGLAYTVSAGITPSAGLLPGTFTAYIGTSPDKVGTALRGFLHEMRRLQDELVPADELEVAKSYLVGSFAMGFERASRRASYLVSAEVHQLPPDNLEALPRAFAAVTPEDVQRVARAHLMPDACCVCAAGPVKRADLEAALAAR
ncbi:MAG: insulinase family protein [Planctomycetes bacterium]|nr:insulinase family protein [Planctomycetota bacterium]